MERLKEELQAADELIDEADRKLSAVAREVKKIAEENSEISSKRDVVDGSIKVTVSHRKTVEKLNRSLPYPFYAKASGSEIEIVRLKVRVEDIDTDREIVQVREVVSRLEEEWGEGAPVKAVLHHATMIGPEEGEVHDLIQKLKQKGEVYEPSTGYLRTT